ncbi:MAG: HAD family phosphatase [Bacteroides sp.]|nr:HAD family phosphatase [Bacteroides sp.]
MDNITINEERVGFLFDLDGVLIDSEREYTRIWGEINHAFPTGISNLPIIIKGMTLVEIIDRYFSSPTYRVEVPKMLSALENKMKYEWTKGAKELLSDIQEKDLPAVLVTSSNEEKMSHLRDELPEAVTYFSEIVTGDRVSHSKPHPEGYLLGASLMGCNPRRCVVFEDSLQGVKAGRAAGAFVIGVAGTLSEDTIAPYADMIVHSLEEISLKSVITELSKR